MKIDNVYVASVFVAINSVHENKDNEASLKISFKLLKQALIYIKQNNMGENVYIDLETKQKYRIKDAYCDIGFLCIDPKQLTPFRVYLYNEQQKNNELVVKNSIPKRKILTIFNDAQKRGKMEVRNEKNI